MRRRDQEPHPNTPASDDAERPWVLFADDGELEDVKRIVEELGATTRRSKRDGHARSGWRQPQRLLVVCDCRAPTLGRPLAQEEDSFAKLAILHERSKALRRQVFRMGFDYVLERPIDADALRRLVLDALYRGKERRCQKRLPVWWPVTLRAGRQTSRAKLVELSHRGCSLRIPAHVGDAARGEVGLPRKFAGGVFRPIRGRVYRERVSPRDCATILSVIFELDCETRLRFDAALDKLYADPPVIGRRGREIAHAVDA
jgi:hypothetical protein